MAMSTRLMSIITTRPATVGRQKPPIRKLVKSTKKPKMVEKISCVRSMRRNSRRLMRI